MAKDFFPFGFRKAMQAVAVLHAAEGVQEVPYYRLLKLLYIANREYMKETGRPIVGGMNVAMDRGPLNSPIYDLIKGEHPEAVEWQKHFSRSGRYLAVRDAPGTDELSKREIRKLHEVSSRLAERDDDEIGVITHGFREYLGNYTEGTSHPIPLQSLLEALGMADREAEIRTDIEQVSALQQLFGA